MISSIIQALALIKIQLNMSQQEKKQQRSHYLLNTETKLKKKKKFQNNWNFFMASIKPRP